PTWRSSGCRSTSSSTAYWPVGSPMRRWRSRCSPCTHDGCGGSDLPADDPVRALRTYLDHLAVERGLADNTMSSYRRDLKRYLTHLTEREITSLGNVTEQVVTDFLVRLREGDAEHPPLGATSAARTVVA